MLKDANIELPSVEELKKLSVKITRFDSDGNEVLLGTGTIVFDGVDYYVLTAAHCFRDDKGNDNCSLEDVVITLNDNNNPSELKKIDWKKSEIEADAAWIKIENPMNQFDYQTGFRFLSNECEKPACVFGYTNGYKAGRRFDFNRKGDCIWRCDEGIISNGGALANTIKGLSGGGLLTKVDDIIYYLGYVKRTYDDYSKLEDVTMFPVANFNLNLSKFLFNRLEDVYGKPVRARECNEKKAHYGELWNELYDQIYNKKDVSGKLMQIVDAKKLYPFPKVVHQQEQVISLLLRKQEQWPDSYRDAFLMALQDRGLWLSLYGEMPKRVGNLYDSDLAQQQTERCESLTLAPNYNNEVTVLKGDEAVYEKIIRAAFSFDFTSMRQMLMEWNAKGFWIVRRALLLNLFDKDQDSLEQLKNYLKGDSYDSLDEEFIATLSHNLIIGDVFNKLPYKKFWDKGIDSVGELLSYISGNIDKRKDETGVFGIHNSLLFGGEDVLSFPESLRLLQTVINTGVVPSMNFITVLAKENWLKAVKHLFRYMPYPIVFYTLTYTDEKILRRVAQELCYAEDDVVREALPGILLKLLESFRNENCPKFFWQSILSMTREWYVAVPVNVWYRPFVDNVLDYFCNKIPTENVSYRDPLFLNIAEAISYIKDTACRKDVLSMLFAALDKNSDLVNRLVEAMKVDDNLLNYDGVEQMLENVLSTHALKDTYKIAYQFFNNCKVSSGLRKAIHSVAEKDDFEFGHNKGVAYVLLSYVLHESTDLEKLKTKTLKLNVWDCGINDGMLTDPNYVHLECYSREIKWSAEEWTLIKSNMITNLEKMKKGGPSFDGMTAHFNKEYIGLLSNMKYFSNRIQEVEKFEVYDVVGQIETILQRKRAYKNVTEALSSDDHDVVVDGLWYLRDRFKDEGIDSCKIEIVLLINRVMLQKPVALEHCLSLLCGIVTQKPKEMTEVYGNSLLELLKKYQRDFDYEALFVSVPSMYKWLRTIAQKVSVEHGDEESVKYWIEEPVVNRFNLYE